MMALGVFQGLTLLSGSMLILLFPTGGEALNDTFHRRLPWNISNSAIPSSKSICTALNAVQFQQNVLITFQGKPGAIGNDGIAALQIALIRSYNKVATCGNVASALLRVSVVNIFRNEVDSFGALITPSPSSNVTQQFTFTATMQGSCRGCKSADFKLWDFGSPPHRRRARKSEPRGSRSSSDRILPAGHSDDPGDDRGKKHSVIPVLCSCSMPTKSSFLKSFNTLSPLPSGIDSLVDISDIESFSPCNSTVTTFETLLTVDFNGTQNFSDIMSVQSQYQMVEQSVLQTYNNLNALGMGDACDPNFLTLTTSRIVTVSSRPAGSSIFDGEITFNVTGSCKGCSGDLPHLFANASKTSRRLNLRQEFGNAKEQEQPDGSRQRGVEPNDDIDFPPFTDSHQRRLPQISGRCYCPLNATELRRPTNNEFIDALNARLNVLGSHGAGLITIVDKAQKALQDTPVNCSSEFNYFEDIVAINYTSTNPQSTPDITPDEATLLGAAFVITYNTLAQRFCDPLFRTVDSVKLLAVNRRLLIEPSPRWLAKARSNRTKASISLTYSVRGRCRGCPSTTPLYNEVTGRRLQVDASSFDTSIPQLRLSLARPDQHRVLQSGASAQCVCSVNSVDNGARAPTLNEFLVTYNQTISSANTSLIVSGGTTAATIPPTQSPTLSPSMLPTQKQSSAASDLLPTNRPTARPTKRRKPPSPPRTPLPTVSHAATATVSPNSKTLTPPITLSPTRRPTIKPTRRPRIPPSIKPTSTTTATPNLTPTVFDPQKPIEAQTSAPSKVITSHPSNHPTTQPSLPPSQKPTPLPSLSPSQKPTTTPTQPPSIQTTLAPTSRTTSRTTVAQPSPIPPPTVNPTPPPSLSPTLKPTAEPTPLPTPQPTLTPTSKPTTPPSQLPTSLPSMRPTSAPTPQPSLSPTVNPTASPTRQPTLPPTMQPTPTPSPQPTLNPTPAPTLIPTSKPTREPTRLPTRLPTATPSALPTASPTTYPTLPPSPSPTPPPTQFPSLRPTPTPTPPPFTTFGPACCTQTFAVCVDYCGTIQSQCENCSDTTVVWAANGVPTPPNLCLPRWTDCGQNVTGCCPGLKCQAENSYFSWCVL